MLTADIHSNLHRALAPYSLMDPDTTPDTPDPDNVPTTTMIDNLAAMYNGAKMFPMYGAAVSETDQSGVAIPMSERLGMAFRSTVQPYTRQLGRLYTGTGLAEGDPSNKTSDLLKKAQPSVSKGRYADANIFHKGIDSTVRSMAHYPVKRLDNSNTDIDGVIYAMKPKPKKVLPNTGIKRRTPATSVAKTPAKPTGTPSKATARTKR